MLSSLAFLYMLLFAAPWASASHHSLATFYQTQLKQDLDGDHIPERATIRQCGHTYQVSIHFTTGRPKLRLTTYLTEGIAGLSLQVTDVDDDRERDLVVTSATSIRPVAVWLNQGKANFRKVSSWVYGGLGRYRGPTLRHREAGGPEPVGASPGSSPQGTPAGQFFAAETDSTGPIHSQPEPFLFDSISWQVAPRGPPRTSRV